MRSYVLQAGISRHCRRTIDLPSAPKTEPWSWKTFVSEELCAHVLSPRPELMGLLAQSSVSRVGPQGCRLRVIILLLLLMQSFRAPSALAVENTRDVIKTNILTLSGYRNRSIRALLAGLEYQCLGNAHTACSWLLGRI